MKAIIISFILYLNIFIKLTKSSIQLNQNQSKELGNDIRNKILSQKNLNLNSNLKFLQDKSQSQEINDVNDDEKSDKDFSFEEILNKKG